MRRECRECFPHYRLQRKPLVSDPSMHHGTCVTHMPWCMSGSLIRGGGKTSPAFPAHAQHPILSIWQEAHWLYFCYCIGSKTPNDSLMKYFTLPYSLDRGIFFRKRSVSYHTQMYYWYGKIFVSHDDVIKWKYFPRYWLLCWEFTGHRSIPPTLTYLDTLEYWDAKMYSDMINIRELSATAGCKPPSDDISRLNRLIFLCSVLNRSAGVNPFWADESWQCGLHAGRINGWRVGIQI